MLTLQVVRDLTGQQPFPNIVRDHFSCHEGCWEKGGHISPVSSADQCLSMEEGSVDINLTAHPKEMPRDPISGTYCDLREVPKDITINGCRKKEESHRGGGSGLTLG